MSNPRSANRAGALSVHPTARHVKFKGAGYANAPWSRHPKKFQDVDKLLKASIDVYMTLNIRRLESLNDVHPVTVAFVLVILITAPIKILNAGASGRLRPSGSALSAGGVPG